MKSERCKCPYPEVTRVGDDAKGKRLVYCITHGFSLKRVPTSAQPKRAVLKDIPTLKWVKAEKVATKRRFEG